MCITYIGIWLLSIQWYTIVRGTSNKKLASFNIFDGSIMIIFECNCSEARDPIVVLLKTFPSKASDINAAGITKHVLISEILYECVF